MMLVSSSGWAHSPITLILTGLSIEFAVGGAALPGIATVIAIAAAVSTAPVNRTRKRFIDRTSDPPPENDGNKWGSATRTQVSWSPLFARTQSREIAHRAAADPTRRPPVPVKQDPLHDLRLSDGVAVR